MTLLTIVTALFIGCSNSGGCNIHVDQGISVSSSKRTYLSCGSASGCEYHLNPNQKMRFEDKK